MLNIKDREEHHARLIGIYGILVSIAALLLFCSPCLAQQPFQTGDGKGTLFLDTGALVQFNIADSSIRVGYIYDSSTSDLTFGVNASAKVAGDAGTLIGGNKIAPNTQFGFTIGKRYLFGNKFDLKKMVITRVFLTGAQRVARKQGIISETTILPSETELKNILASAGAAHNTAFQGHIASLSDTKVTAQQYLDALTTYCTEMEKTDSFCGLKGKDMGDALRTYGNFNRLVFKGDYGYRQYTLFAPTLPFSQQIYKKDFRSPSAQVIYTQQFGGNKLFGASVGVEKSNNSGDLTEVDIRDFMSTTSGTTNREFGRTRKALLGDFRQYTRTFANTDFAWFPGSLKNRVGINFFTRSEITGDDKGFRPGVGIFLSEKGAPTRVIGGVSFSLDNNGKANVALTAGYNF